MINNAVGLGDPVTSLNVSFEPWSFAILKAKLDMMLDQTTGDPCAICQAGEEYIEFLSYGIARPDDVAIVEQFVARKMAEELYKYFSNRGGTIYWRIPFESSIDPISITLHLDKNGPDLDFTLNERCVQDKNWMKLSCYCRLYKAKYKTIKSKQELKVA